MNADGLPDIVAEGEVLYNHINATSGHPEFSRSQGPIGSPLAGGLLEVDEKELEETLAKNPLHDVVRMWQAPYSGTVSIHAPVRLLPPGEEKEEG